MMGGSGPGHDSGIERPYLYIAIADGKLWLNNFALDDGVVAGFDGWSEQCDQCGGDIEEHGILLWKRSPGCLFVKCPCGAEYMVHNADTGHLVDQKPPNVEVDNRR